MTKSEFIQRVAIAMAGCSSFNFGAYPTLYIQLISENAERLAKQIEEVSDFDDEFFGSKP